MHNRSPVHHFRLLEMNANCSHITEGFPVQDQYVGANSMQPLQREILRTLLYYDIWEYPLHLRELPLFLKTESPVSPDLIRTIASNDGFNGILEHNDYYFVQGRDKTIVERRLERERHARWMWKMARLSMHVIKRFPFVRAVFVSGDLSKNSTARGSDVDFFILTEPGRLWITRTLLILFKKVFLLNSKKFFCLNYFKTTDQLSEEGYNIYSATEVAHLKPLYNMALYDMFMNSNMWIREFFPQYQQGVLPSVRTNNRRSVVQRLIEALFRLLPLDRIDTLLMENMQRVWERRYPQYDGTVRDRIFRSTKQESRAYGGNFQEKILSMYARKLEEFGVAS